MEAILVLIWVLPGPGVYVPMPDWATCEEAIAEAKSELNPTRVYCRRLESTTVTIIRNMMKPTLDDTCIPCVERWWERDIRGRRPW